MIQSNRRNEVWKKINYMVLQQRVPVAPQQWWFGRVWNSRALKPGIMSSLSLLGSEGYEITWFSNMYHNIISIILGLEGCEITWFSNNSVPFICYTLDLEGCEIAGCSNPTAVENHECAGLEEDKIAGFSNWDGSPVLRYKYKEITGHSNQQCRRFCFVIIIPYPDRKANICSICRCKKMSTISRYWLNVGHKQWYRSDKINLQCLLLIWASEPERIES